MWKQTNTFAEASKTAVDKGRNWKRYACRVFLCPYFPFNTRICWEKASCYSPIDFKRQKNLLNLQFKGKVRSRKSFAKLRKLFPRNSKIIAVLSSSLLKCDKSALKLPLSWLGERHLGYDVLWRSNSQQTCWSLPSSSIRADHFPDVVWPFWFEKFKCTVNYGKRFCGSIGSRPCRT